MMASHSSFNSRSEMPLRFIRYWRMATDTKCAVSISPLLTRDARHCSSNARIEGDRSSELATGVLSDTELARKSGGDPVVRFMYVSIQSGYFRNGAVDFIRRHFLQRVAGRSVAQKSDLMIAVECVDQGRQAGRFASKSGQHDATAVLVHQRREGFAGVAGRTAALEDHLVAVRLKAFNPAHERRGAIEKRGFTEHADECNRQANAARMLQNLSAIIERALNPRYRQQPRRRHIFLLQVHENDGRDTRRIGKGTKAYN